MLVLILELVKATLGIRSMDTGEKKLKIIYNAYYYQQKGVVLSVEKLYFLQVINHLMLCLDDIWSTSHFLLCPIILPTNAYCLRLKSYF